MVGKRGDKGNKNLTIPLFICGENRNTNLAARLDIRRKYSGGDKTEAIKALKVSILRNFNLLDLTFIQLLRKKKFDYLISKIQALSTTQLSNEAMSYYYDNL